MLILSWILSSLLMYPKSGVCSEKYIVFCGDPTQQGLEFEPFKIITVDQIEIFGWLMPVAGSKSYVILSHGRGADRREGMRFARTLVQSGFNVIAFDYRNAGESSQSFNSLGYFEKRDLQSIVEFTLKRGAQKVGVYGFSQGGATGLTVMAEDLRISAGAFEGAFSNAQETVAEAARRDYYLPEFPFIDLAFSMFRLRTGASLADVKPDQAVAKIGSRPVYLIHALGDPIVYSSHSKKLLAHLPKAKSWFYEDNHHVQSWQYDRLTAEKNITNFFKEAFEF